MKFEEVKMCSFVNWYDDFRKISFKSIILPLPDGFIKYILKDGIVLPKSEAVCTTVNDEDTDEDDEKEEVWRDEDIAEAEAPYFPEFNKCIENAIESLGGKVFPKLNWSSPKDASWIAFNNSCCCTSVSDIYLLLKSSDFIIHDITKAFKQCEDFVEDHDMLDVPLYLVLRKWVEVDISGEFRCFVKDNELIGISQREYSLYFDHIPKCRNEIIEDIMYFFKTLIQHKFKLSNYVFDVYRKKKGKLFLVDFNPFGTTTESLLFSWEELNSDYLSPGESDYPIFRCVEDNCGVQPRILSYHALPRDIVDISTGEDSFKLIDLIKLKIEEQSYSSTDEEG